MQLNVLWTLNKFILICSMSQLLGGCYLRRQIINTLTMLRRSYLADAKHHHAQLSGGLCLGSQWCWPTPCTVAQWTYRHTHLWNQHSPALPQSGYCWPKQHHLKDKYCVITSNMKRMESSSSLWDLWPGTPRGCQKCPQMLAIKTWPNVPFCLRLTSMVTKFSKKT